MGLTGEALPAEIRRSVWECSHLGGHRFAPRRCSGRCGLELAERGTRPRKQPIENNIRQALEGVPGIRSKVGLGGSGEKYVLVLTGEDPQALATAVNQEFVARDARAARVLQAGDQVFTFQPITGG